MIWVVALSAAWVAVVLLLGCLIAELRRAHQLLCDAADLRERAMSVLTRARLVRAMRDDA